MVVTDEKGMQVKTTKQAAMSVSTPKIGLFATHIGLLLSQGSGMPKIGPKIRVAVIALCSMLASAGLLAAVPTTAVAYATIEGPPSYSSAPGLPDGRIYEQVSPANKNGNEAGSGSGAFYTGATSHYGLASPDGNSVLFEGTGPMGESPWAGSQYFVATKNKEGEAGWSTRAFLPRYRQSLVELGGDIQLRPTYLDPAPDLAHALVMTSGQTFVVPQLDNGCGRLYLTTPYLTVPPLEEAKWLEQPELNKGEKPVENNCFGAESGAPVGGTPNFSTVYFAYAGTLLPEDAPRALHAGSGDGVEAWGFYEDREGSLREAGVLPDGKLDAFGAVPAVSGHGRAIAGNQVAAEGTRAFFVSPDPASCTSNGGHNDCETDPPQLYMRENGEKTVLVSQDTLLPSVDGLPAGSPVGVLQMPNPVEQSNGASAALDGSYVFASPNGSQAIFQSTAALTASAEQASPGPEPKAYDFDVNTGELTYLPGVAGEIVATDMDGSSFAFVRPESGSEPAELDLWSAGSEGSPGEGTITPVVRLPGPPTSGTSHQAGGRQVPVYVDEGRMSDDGSVFVFTTNTGLSSAFNSGGQEEIYRYDVPAKTLGCVSCAPIGVTPRGPASMSPLQPAETYEEEVAGKTVETVNSSGMSADGSRIFFESLDPLVKQDANTDSPPLLCHEGTYCAQGRDVYEWENGVVYLISGGKSPRNTYLLGNSESGSNVFFSTSEGLVPSDTDGGYDVYDARIPHAGDNPPAAVPCEGSDCQGPPNVPSPLTPPASTTFSGLGNPAAEPAAVPAKAVTKKTARCKKGHRKNKQGQCVKQKTKAKKTSNDRRAK